jgi:hypothetical protein
MMMIKKPIHKLNGGNGATLCIKCSVVICTGLKDILYCDNCKKKVMTPKQKAEELVNKFKKHSYTNMFSFREESNLHNAKQSALIAVDEILNHHSQEQGLYRIDIYYWQQVKQEIEKI